MELERLDRNDPIKKFSEKIAVQKTLTFSSPTRSPPRNDGNNHSSANQRINIDIIKSNKNSK